jgi:hypothetical protein
MAFSKFNLNFNLIKSDMDNEDGEYDYGRSYGSKRKRGAFDDYDSDDDSSSKNTDPNAYDSKLANHRFKMIRAEFDKRRSGASEECERAKKIEISEEEKELAKTTQLIDPCNNKIQNLGLKSRTNWHTKILQTLKANGDMFGSSDSEINRLAIEFEHETFSKAKNLITYQASCMKRISEITKATKSGKSFIAEYKMQKENEEAMNKKLDESIQNEDDETTTSSKENSDFKPQNTNVGFTSALSLLSVNKTEISVKKEESNSFEFDFLKFKEENPINKEPKVEINDESCVNSEFKKPKVVKSEPEIQEIFVKPSVLEMKKEKLAPDFKTSLKVKEVKKESTQIDKASKVPSEKKASSSRLDLSKISILVVTELTVLYKTGKFANKDLFKNLARTISHFVLEKKQPKTETDATTYVKTLTSKLNDVKKIESESDYQFIFS